MLQFKGTAHGHSSRHAGFNKMADAASLIVGNVQSNVQTSAYIRPRQRLECNGFTNEPGHLQEFDLKTFGFGPNMGRVLRYIRTEPFFETDTAIGYSIFHFVGQQKTLHGFILTDSANRLIRRFDLESLGLRCSYKSKSVLDFCLPYLVTNKPALNPPA